MPAIFARGLVIPALPSLLDAYPGLDIELAISDEQFSLAQEAMDCTVRIGPIRESRVVAKEVGRLSHALCAAPSYLRRKGMPRTVAELDGHHAVALNHGDWSLQKPWGPAGAATAVSRRSRIMVNDEEAMISCAVLGLGIVSAYRLALWPYIEKGLLVEIPIDCGPVDAPVSIVFYPSRHLPSKIRLFMNWLGDVLAEGVRIAEAGRDMTAPAVLAPWAVQPSRSVPA
jgi:LysR family transcriptional regulator for bpeEF and oprC